MPVYHTTKDRFLGKALRKANTRFHTKTALKKPLPKGVTEVKGQPAKQTQNRQAANKNKSAQSKQEIDQSTNNSTNNFMGGDGSVEVV